MTYNIEKQKLMQLNSQQVGILGGSFNPPHKGHVQISLYAMEYFNLAKVVWLISPLNPFKENQKNTMESLKKRKEMCEELIHKKYKDKIIISTIEEYFNTNYTHDSLIQLQKIITNSTLLWIMGEDNLTSFHKFYKWQKILKNFNVVAFARYMNPSIISNAYVNKKILSLTLSSSIVKLNKLQPKLYYCNFPIINISSTEIRNNSDPYIGI